MSVIVKEYQPEDTMAEMEMERALEKLKLGSKKDPNDLPNKFASIKCQYSLELSVSKKKAQILRLGGSQYSSIIATTSMIYCKNKKKLTTEKLPDKMHLQWRLAGGKLKGDKDSDGKDVISLAATNTKKGGKKLNGGGKPKKKNLIRIRSATTAIKRSILRPCAGKSTLRRNKSLQRIARASKQASRSSISKAVIDDSEGEIILAATSHGEQYVYLDHDIINDDKESILKVFTGQIHSVDITNAYLYAPVIDDIIFF
jgi:hypothetical protein